LVKASLLEAVKMRIAFLSHALILSDGTSTVFWNLAKRLVTKGHEVTIFTFFNSDYKDDCGVQIQEIPIPFKENKLVNPGLLPLFQNKWREIRRQLQQYQVIYSHLWPACLIPSFPTKLKGPRHIMTEWGIGKSPGASLYEKLHLYFTEKMEGYAVRHADRVIAPSLWVEQYIKEKFKVSTTTRMYIDGIDFGLLDKSLISDKGIYDKYPSLEGSHIILSVGRVCPRKNIGTLIRSFGIVQRKIPNTKLIIIGAFNRNLSYYHSLVKLIAEMGLRESVIFTGAVSWQDLPKYYAACDIFASSSVYEGFLRAEAYAMEKPMVAFDITSNSETIKHGETGLLVRELTPEAFASALITLLGDDELRAQMGKKGYQWAKENLDFDKIAQDFARFIDDSLAARG
jgi:1,2-diacylglycerol 3-alpha-glucosyltransferase